MNFGSQARWRRGPMAVERVRAFAKINLALRVLGVREDGYHELRTILQSLALHDTLEALSRRWRVDDRRMRTVAASLGADVPYFLEGGTVLGLDRGDRLFPLLDYPRAWVVLVVPGFGVST